jgi:hypothetical protein
MKQWLLCFLLCGTFTTHAQNQLVLLKGERLLFRFIQGDHLEVTLKSGRKLPKSFIVSVNDTTIITGYDTIPIHEIKKVHVSRKTLLNQIGLLAMMGGVGYFLIDEFNSIVVNGEKPDVDEGVAKVSAGLLVGGATLYFIRKKSERIRGRVRLLSADRQSYFYKRDYQMEKGYVSPHIPKN